MGDDRQLRRTGVDLGGILRILGESLYSTPTVAVRELIQNAHDSCTRRRIESHDGAEPRIVVVARPGDRTLSIEDNGAGLTGDEIVRYLATVGSGYTRTLREGAADEGRSLIGQFGIGFLSAFVVADRVEVHTTSHREPGVGHRFEAQDGETYSLDAAPARTVGTRVTLRLKPSAAMLSQPEAIEALLVKYCALLSIPIHVGQASSSPVNRPLPPWRTEPAPQGAERARVNLTFAARYEHAFEPICAFEVGGAEAPARGLVWVQDGATYGTSDNRNVSVFVRGMLVSTDARDLLPSWAGFCGALIESDELTPTASREDVQRDPTYERIQKIVSSALVDGLERTATEAPAAWRRILLRHNEALLGAALCDDRLFDVLQHQLKLPTSDGDLTMRAIKSRSGDRIHVSLGERGGYEEIVFRAMGIPVVIGTRYAVLPFSRKFAERTGTRLIQIGTGTGDREFFAPAEATPAEAEALETLRGDERFEVVASRFEPNYLPLLLVPDREAELKRRMESDEADRRIAPALLSLARQYTGGIDGRILARVYVNLDSPVIRKWLDSPADRQAQGARLLRSFATMLATRGDSALESDLSATLEEFSNALLALLGP